MQEFKQISKTLKDELKHHSYQLSNQQRNREDKLEDHDDDINYCNQYLPQGISDEGDSSENHEPSDCNALNEQEG